MLQRSPGPGFAASGRGDGSPSVGDGGGAVQIPIPDGRRGSPKPSLIGHDPLDDFLGDDLAQPGGVATLAFPTIGEEATFNEDGGPFGEAQHFEAGGFDAAVFGVDAFAELVLDFSSKLASLGGSGVIEGLDAGIGSVAVAVEVEADKNEVLLAIGDCRPLVERDVIVTGPGEDGGNAFGFQHALDTFGKVEGEFFFINTVPVAAFVATAVAGIDHHSGKVFCQRPGWREKGDPEK